MQLRGSPAEIECKEKVNRKRKETKIRDYIKASLLACIAKILFFHIIVGLKWRTSITHNSYTTAGWP
jgi:hypothetical protein